MSKKKKKKGMLSVLWFEYVYYTMPDSFQVMIQHHNREMSFSFYIAALAVSDTITLLIGMYKGKYALQKSV